MALSKADACGGRIEWAVFTKGGGAVCATVYMLRLSSGAIYIGATEEVKRRYDEHIRGVACRSTRLDPPLDLIYTEEHPNFPSARNREAQLKRWTRAKKEALASGNATRLKALAKRRTR